MPSVFTKSRPNPVNAGMAGFSWIAVVPYRSDLRVVQTAGAVATLPVGLLPAAGVGQFFLKQNMGLIETKTLSENRSGSIMGEMTLTLNAQTALPGTIVPDIPLSELRAMCDERDVLIFASLKGSENVICIGAQYGCRSGAIVNNYGAADGDLVGLTVTFSTSEPVYADQYVLAPAAVTALTAAFAVAQ